VTALGPGELTGYWQWRDALLRHPDGRAVGGEPCVKCGRPVPANAAWQHRDRRVCGARCNLNLGRQLNRLIEKGVDLPIPRPAPMPDPRRDPSPQVFTTLPEPGPSGLRYEFDGFGPRAGDAVVRHGAITVYDWVRPETPAPQYAPHGLFVAQHYPSGHSFVRAASPDGTGTRLMLGCLDSTGARLDLHATFESQGQRLAWVNEFITDVTPDGREFTWEATVAVPVDAGHPRTLWTAARTALSEERKRTSSSTARHARRIRLEEATVERFDPVEVFERDGWICRLCGRPVDPSLRWPDPAAASLDHVVPLIAGGGHSRANSQLAHWLCNVKKGARGVELD
jgi:5-methylcytosine-specific restriction endonuclease McrA